ncbi:Bug family tripartite tricarboxylate transporter substrate binding protein [Pollutimonas bauzanensis]|uniref:Tripartite-type tricarboxylate transporter, receptor component TctC n=1 Tax=Pollutimonas bauzanensis TaxID=658167 RepID=A0A1M5NI84_9BURK|nr:tripartite tricarboxylate transporter substrate-binding protein [Pollutimonas bauzanensis]SHG89294.1 Tripartite-type tricarboxylate transporter, receptor component TctC [Pollutimonas bauzanensis]
MKRRILLQAGLAGLFAPALAARAAAGDPPPSFPVRNVRLVVPVAAGGSSDKLARTLAQRLSELWGHTVVVENLPGASSAIGNGHVARSVPDGYTLLLGGDSLSLGAVQGKLLSYDPTKDFTGITKAVVNPQLLAVGASSGIKTFQEFVALAKSRPNKVTLGLPSGLGSLQHLAVELLGQRVGIRLNNIPYPGGGPAMLDVLGGHIDSTLITLAAATQNVRAGKLVALAVTTSYRSDALPEVPTLQELGLDGYAIESWQGIVAPAGTPQAIVDKIHRDTVSVLRQDKVASQLEGLGFKIAASTPQEVNDTIIRDIGIYKKIAADAGITL